jgi:hypothetical protein
MKSDKVTQLIFASYYRVCRATHFCLNLNSFSFSLSLNLDMLSLWRRILVQISMLNIMIFVDEVLSIFDIAIHINDIISEDS